MELSAQRGKMRSIDEYMWRRNTGRKKLDIGQEAISSLYFLEVPPTGGLRVCMISGYLIVIGKMGLRQTAV